MMIKGVVGLDLSLTGTGICRVSLDDRNERTVMSANIGTVPGDGTLLDRAEMIASKLLRRVGMWDIVLIEDYAWGIKPQKSSVVTLAELGGIVKIILKKHTKWEPFVIGSSTVKGWLGAGQMRKDMIPVAAYKKYGREFKTHDEYVSRTLADIGVALIGRQDRDLFKYEETIIHKLRTRYADQLKTLKEVTDGD